GPEAADRLQAGTVLPVMIRACQPVAPDARRCIPTGRPERRIASFALDASPPPRTTKTMDPQNQQPPPLLSDLVEDRLSRRFFLQRASIAGAAMAAASCAPSSDQGGVAADSASVAGGTTMNANSRADSALDNPHTGTSQTAAVGGAEGIEYHRFDPTLPPLPAERTTRLHWRAQEVPVRIGPNLVVAAWTFEGDVPGPIVRVRQGDTVEFTLTNEGVMPHSMDFHAAQLDPRVAFRSVG